MDRSVNRIQIELRDCQHVVPKLIRSTSLPTLDSKVLLIADLDGDGTVEVLILQDGKHLAYFPLREQQDRHTTQSFHSPLDGHPLLLGSNSGSSSRGTKKAAYLAATVGADGVLKEPPSSLLQHVVDGGGSNSHANSAATGRALFDNNNAMSLESLYPAFYRQQRGQHQQQSKSGASAAIPGLTFFQISGLPLYEQKQQQQQQQQYGNSRTAIDPVSATDVIEKFTVINALWMDESKLDFPAAQQGQPLGGGGLVLILLEGFVVFISATELRRSMEKVGDPSREGGDGSGGAAAGGAGADAVSEAESNMTATTAKSHNTMGGTASPPKTAGGNQSQQQQQQQQNQQHIHQSPNMSTDPKVATLHFSQFESVWEVPWNCCCSALDPNTGTVYVGFACGLLLALPVVSHCYKQHHATNISSSSPNVLPSNASLSSSNVLPIPPNNSRLGKGVYSASQTSISSTPDAPGPVDTGGGGITSSSSFAATATAAAAAAAVTPSKISQQNTVATALTIPGDGASAAAAPHNSQKTRANDAGAAGGNSAGRGSSVTAAASASGGGGGGGGSVVIPASVHSSSLTINDAPIHIQPLSYGPDSRNTHAVLIAMRDNVVLVDASCFAKASFTQTLSSVQLLWALQVSCTSLEVFQLSRESASWCVVTDTGAVFLLQIDVDGRISRTEFKLSCSPVLPADAAGQQQQNSYHHSQQQQQSFLGADAPRYAFLTLDGDDELCVVIVSENGGITVCDKRRRAVHSVGAGSRCISRATTPSSSSADTSSALTASASRRVQSVHEVVPLSTTSKSMGSLSSPGVNAASARQLGSAFPSNTVATPMRRAASMAMAGGGGGGSGAGGGGGGSGGLVIGGAPAPLLGVGGRAGLGMGPRTATTGDLHHHHHQQPRSTTSGGLLTATSTTTSAVVSPAAALAPTSSMLHLVAQPELLLMDGGAIRHVQIKLPRAASLEKKAQQQAAEKAAEACRKLQNQLRESGVIGPSVSLLSSCNFPSAVAFGNAIVSDRAALENFKAQLLMKRSGSGTMFVHEGEDLE